MPLLLLLAFFFFLPEREEDEEEEEAWPEDSCGTGVDELDEAVVEAAAEAAAELAEAYSPPAAAGRSSGVPPAAVELACLSLRACALFAAAAMSWRWYGASRRSICSTSTLLTYSSASESSAAAS